MTWLLWAIVVCGALSIVYGVVTTRGLLASDAGTARMQEISAAVREGASAYLRRQYTTIAIVGVVIAIAAIFLLGWYAAIGFVAAVFGVLAGTAAGWGIVTQVMRIEFVSDPRGAILAATAAVGVTVLFGLVGTIKILTKAPASHLRNL